MGLDSFKHEDTDTSKSGGGRSRKKKKEDEKVTIGSKPYQKTFKKEKWEGVKDIIRRDFEVSVNEVKNSPPEERYDILHEAALIHEGEKTVDNSSHKAKTRCVVCGDECAEESVEIEGHAVHWNHPAVQVRKKIDEEEDE